jgi:hypothetical protein
VGGSFTGFCISQLDAALTEVMLQVLQHRPSASSADVVDPSGSLLRRGL